uniref:Histone-lysine N-methyltransferase SUVR5 isoform X1 n=1 Tax=Elaeis guineensis var. tenera TaxID=51953 RepID=A0A6I9QC43_ELAGV|nr:histone-lysine N-methyltransferase SUVR5 isoform X1 [Elaeis guineensis]
MSVLSLSEVQYVGERSPVTKPTEDILEESTLLQVDGTRKRVREKLSLAICDRKQILLEVDDAQRGPADDRLDSREDGTFKELHRSPQRHNDEVLDNIHATEKPLPNIDMFQQGQVHEQLSNKHEGNANFPDSDKHEENACFPHTDSQLAECKILNGMVEEETSFLREKKINEDVIHLRIESHSYSGQQCNEVGSCFEPEQGVQLIDRNFKSNDNMVPAKDSQGDKICEFNNREDAPCSAESIQTDTSDSCGEEEDQSCLPHKLSDFEPDLPEQGQKNNSFLFGNASHSSMQNMNNNVQNINQEGESGLLRNEYVEQDQPVALWVKWRGKWQTGIRCPRADCPLSALKAKPTHERKRYVAVFFPRTRTYSWADMLLVRSIGESPEPLVNGNHRRWRKLVKDLTLPRRYIMQKLAFAMLNISDQLHTEAVIEDARKATTWKEFAMEASHCRDYLDLGKMLLKLQNMILPSYISQDWLGNSFDLWIQRCQSAQTAESIEILTKELVDSVCWTQVDELWNAPVQPELGPEWRTWKQEAMKWFFSWHPSAIGGDLEQKRICDISAGMEPQISRKRPKLEIRRAEPSVSPLKDSGCALFSQINTIVTDSGHLDCQNMVESTLTQEPCKVAVQSGVAVATVPGIAADRCDRIKVEGNGVKFVQGSEVCMSTDGECGKETIIDSHIESDSVKRYHQCAFFVEAKGRRCGRWANDGAMYCCVHLNAHSGEKPSQKVQRPPVGSPMCEGTTTHGRKCKHRARIGSAFCKKHHPHSSHDSVMTENLANPSENTLKNAIDSKEYGSVGEVQMPVQENLIPIVVGETLDERNCLMKKSELYNALPVPVKSSSPDLPRCIGYYRQNNGDQCLEYAKRHTLYCEKHLPKFLKRARNGKSRLISKDIFVNLLKNCSSRKQKIYLHQACELLYGFMKSSLSRQKPVSRGDTMGWILSEASKDAVIGEFLLKLVTSEREKLMRIWGFSADKDKQISSLETKVASTPLVHEKANYPEMTVKCKICAEEFSDDQKLGLHWTEVHKKEARWLFRGFACAVCMNSFTNRKVLETHVKDKHGIQFLEHSILFRCMSCSSHFVNPEQLWQHVLSLHAMDFRLPDLTRQPLDQAARPKMEMRYKLCNSNDVSEKDDGSQRFLCRFCGLRFDLLPDLGRHHQVAHMNPNSMSHFPQRRANHLLRNRHCYPRFRKSFGTSFRLKNQTSFRLQKHLNSSNLALSSRPRLQTQAPETASLGMLLESHCSDVAQTLFSKIQKTKPRPSNLEILSIARSACCRISLHAALEVKYGILPENLYLKAAKLCSELNIQVDWHLEGYICPKGCKPLKNRHSLAPLKPVSDGFEERPTLAIVPVNDAKWEMDECHYILNSEHFNWKPKRKAIILCEDVSFGREPVPIVCVIDEEFKDSFHVSSNEAPSGQELGISMPWRGFTYVTERLIEPSLGLDTKNSQLGCACPNLKCYPESCDHVYLFDNDYENAEDIHGKSMHGRFAYDERGRIVLEEGYLVYECNSMCKCAATCQNRVLQRGVQVKLEIFRTEKKGWAVRAGEAISRGTFVCEYIGEVLNDEEANRRGERYDQDGCSYLYDIDAHIDGARGLSEGTVPYVIDATKYGNVSRFINHSCSPNLVNYLVLVESMDCQLAHIGLYASRDIAVGEELAYDYRYKFLPGDGRPCYCGAPNCRGRLY